MSEFVSHVRRYLRWYILLALIILGIILLKVVLSENNKGIMTFSVLYVGQGDAIFIESPTGKQVLVDGGPGKTIMREISSVMPWYDRHIDLIVVTNPDKDHYEGFIPLLDKYSVSAVLESGTDSATDTYDFFGKEISERNIQKIIALRGQKIDLGGGAYLEILFPDRDISGLSPNDGSIVMRLVYGETSVLLQGDSTRRIEEYLITLEGEKLDSDILKVGHHGSKTSSVEKYIEVVSPEWAIISSGVNNNYGHPHKETLDTLDKFKVETLGTCSSGRIIFKSDGKIFKLKNKNPKEVNVGCKE